jgi:CheY-like chemotaxis protein
MGQVEVSKKLKVLIVDDDKDMLEMMVDLFESEGMKVITAVDGVDASFKFSNEEFDAVITDIKMPKKDGIKFVEHIQVKESQRMMTQESAYKPLPIFLISASVHDYRAELDLLSNVEIIPKPFSTKDVLRRVQIALDRNATNGPPSAALRYKSGDIVMKEGDVGSDIFLVKSGQLRVTKKGANNSEVTICTIGAGEIVGEMGFFLHKTRSASVVTTLDSELISIPKEKFDTIISAQPKWFKVFIETMASRLDATTKELVEIKSKSKT